MSFFDSKQETIDIELTSYGKQLLSKGKLKPVYYAFFDDDVVYDPSYIEITESQNDIQQRIMNETPVSKPKYVFTGTDKTVRQNLQIYTDYISLATGKPSEVNIFKVAEPQSAIEKSYALSAPIGKSSHNSDYAPAWQVNLMSGTISSSNQYIDNSDGTANSLQPYQKIPQLNLEDAVQDLLLIKSDSFVEAPENYEDIGFIINSDGEVTNIHLKLEQYLLEVLEKNVDDIKENFDIEVFIEEQDRNNKFWKQLSFIKQPVYIKNNILLDKPEEAKNASEIYKNPNFVEHYFRILVDDEIILPPKQKIKVEAYNTTQPDSVGEDC